MCTTDEDSEADELGEPISLATYARLVHGIGGVSPLKPAIGPDSWCACGEPLPPDHDEPVCTACR